MTDNLQEHGTNKDFIDNQWKPGQSGNPGGRPKGKSITAELRKLIDQGDTAEELADILYKMSKKDLAALKELLDRTDGKVLDKHLSVTVAITPERLQDAQERLRKAEADTMALLEEFPRRKEG